MDDRVFLASCPDYSPDRVQSAVDRILDGFGGTAGIFGELRGRTVFLKVNLVSPVPPERAVTTHPAVAAALARRLAEAGARVVIGDTCTTANTEAALDRLYRITGMTEAAEASGAELMRSTEHRQVKAGNRTFDLMTAVLDADFLVSCAKLKTHGLAYYTGAVKNLFGCIPGLEKGGTHAANPNKQQFFSVICDLCDFLSPAFSLVDGVVGMEGPGPSNGYPKAAKVLGGAVNPYALDLAMCECVSFSPASVPVLREGEQRGRIPDRASRLTLLGDELSSLKTVFQPAVGGRSVGVIALALGKVIPSQVIVSLREQRAPWPRMTEACVRCGKCAEICPRHTITVGSDRAWPDYSRCIRCYCCQEVCPADAIRLGRRPRHAG